jgi:hypothetical protein
MADVIFTSHNNPNVPLLVDLEPSKQLCRNAGTMLLHSILIQQTTNMLMR